MYKLTYFHEPSSKWLVEKFDCKEPFWARHRALVKARTPVSITESTLPWPPEKKNNDNPK